MPTALCHCGSVRLSVPERPETLTDCNCSICRRYGVLWAYYKVGDVTIEAAPKATDSYMWGDKSLRFVRCATCGCIICWQPVISSPEKKMGVNARNFEPSILGTVAIRKFDGAAM